MTAPKRPRVVDFSTHFSGPVASRHLVQLGADVIKVEHPRRGDGNRDLPPLTGGTTIHHLYLNAGTRSVAAAPGTPLWKPLIERLAGWADVVVVGNRPESARRIGIDVAAMRRHNPDLIYCLVSGYGLDGEWAGRPAHGLNMDALAGVVPVASEDGRPVTPAGFRTVGTTLAGIEAALGILAALYRRASGGGAQVVHVSVWESALSWMWRDLTAVANGASSWTEYKDLGPRYALYRTSDEEVVLVCPVERHFWERFCDLLGLPAPMRERGDWSGGMDFGSSYRALGEANAIQAAIGHRPLAEWLAAFADADIPAAPILDLPAVLGSPHAVANGVIVRTVVAGREMAVPTSPVSVTPARDLPTGSDAELARAHRDKGRALGPPPELGQHTSEVLAELGLSTADLLSEKGHLTPADTTSPR